MNLNVSRSQGKVGDTITVSWQTTADGGTLSITDGQNTQDITGQASGSVTWAINGPPGGKQVYHCVQQGDSLIDEAYASVSILADAPPPTTTVAPASQSAQPPTQSTAAPASSETTAAPANQSTAAPGDQSTIAPASNATTAAPADQSTAAPSNSTTTAPGASGSAPAFDPQPSVKIDPDGGESQDPTSYQVPTDATLTLSWNAINAAGVSIDPLGEYGAAGSAPLPTQDATYTLVAKASDGSQSAAVTINVATHAPGEVVSTHASVSSGVAKVVSFVAQDAQGNSITVANSGDAITLVLVVTNGADGATIYGQSAALTAADGGNQQATLTVNVSMAMTGEFEGTAMQGGSAADSSSIRLTIGLDPSINATTTAAPAAAPTLTLNAQPLFGKPGDDCTVSWTMDPPDTPGTLSLTDGSQESDVSGQTQVVWKLNAAPGAKQFYHLVHHSASGTQDAEAFADPVEIAAADPTDATGTAGAATGSDGGEITIVEQVDTWKKELTPEGAKVEVSITLELQGAIVWSGAEADKPSVADATAQAKAAAESASSANLEVPLSGGIGSPTFSAGGDLSLFSSEYTNKKKEGGTEYTFAEKELFKVTFQSPGYQNPTITIPVTAAVATLDLSKPLDSALGVLSGSVELTLVAGKLPIVGTPLAVSGGLVVALGVSTQLATFGSILKDAGIDLAEDAGLDTTASAVFDALVDAAGTEAAADAFVVALEVGVVVAAIVVVVVIVYEYEKDLADEAALQAVLAGMSVPMQQFSDGFSNGWNNPGLQAFMQGLNLSSSQGPQQDGLTLGTNARKQAQANLIAKYQTWWNQYASQPDQRQAAVDQAFTQGMATSSGQAAFANLLSTAKTKYNSKLQHDTFMQFFNEGRGFDQCKELFIDFWGQPPATDALSTSLKGMPSSVVFPSCPKDCYEAMMQKDPTHFPDWRTLSAHPPSWG